jgi:hypothetical protein
MIKIFNMFIEWFKTYWKYIIFPVGLGILLLGAVKKKKLITTDDAIKELNTEQISSATTFISESTRTEEQNTIRTEEQVKESAELAQDKKEDSIQDVVKWYDKL